MIDKNQFEELVIKAINELPAYFRQKMENITIHIEDVPDRDTLKHLGYQSPYSILGLYQGVPTTRRGIHYRNVMPDRIIIYRKPILRKNNKIQAIKNDIKRVVLHEIGHYFGLSEHELRSIERKNINNNKIK
ncbi:MAG: metallopeptidase family protein [Atribacterota bacterium]